MRLSGSPSELRALIFSLPDYGVGCLLSEFYSVECRFGSHSGISYIATLALRTAFRQTLLRQTRHPARDPLTHCTSPLDCLARSVWEKCRINNAARDRNSAYVTCVARNVGGDIFIYDNSRYAFEIGTFVFPICVRYIWRFVRVSRRIARDDCRVM